MTLISNGYDPLTNDFSSSILNPPNRQLRWEKTATTNIGLDFAFWHNRLSGSIDYYNRYTTDLLAFREADPTLGWGSLLLNYGSLRNRGIETTLNADLISLKDFSWSASLNYSYNNKLLNVEDVGSTIQRYTNGHFDTSGYPSNAVFSFKFAGLSPEDGSPLYYNEEGEKINYVTSIKALEYSGTNTPKRVGSLTNTFTFLLNFQASFMLPILVKVLIFNPNMQPNER